MSYIYIRGSHEPVEVENKDAKNIKAKWEQCMETKRHEPLDIGALSIMTSEIKAIRFEIEADENQDHNKEIEKYLENREKFKNYSLQVKAQKSIQHFALVLFSRTGKTEINDTQRQYVTGLLESFFEKNPNWTVPSVKAYDKVIRKIGIDEPLDDKDELIREGAMRMLNNVEWNELKKNNWEINL